MSMILPLGSGIFWDYKLMFKFKERFVSLLSAFTVIRLKVKNY